MTIRILVTGGTFDKEYNERTGQLYFKDTHIKEMLQLGRAKIEVSIRTVMMVDSLEMTEADREQLYRCVADANTSRVIITHGTDTMTATAARLASIPGKTIVMTGALTPARFSESDASFNLGMAFAAAQIAPAGVYIVMNGEVFPAAAVRKDREAARFVRVG